MVQILLHAVVGDEYISEAVAVVVGEGHAQGPSLFGGNTRFLADIRECTVAVIVIKDARRRGKFLRRTVGVPLSAADLAVFRVPFHIAGDEQIQLAVVIVIEKTG